MAVRFYLVPPVTSFDGALVSTRAAYTDVGALDPSWDLRGRAHIWRYGMEDAYLLRADLSTAEHNSLIAQAGVTAFPSNLNSSVTAGQLATVRTALESRNFPGLWVTTAHTHRQVLKAVWKTSAFMRRLRGVFKVSVFAGGRTLDTIIGDLTVTQRQWLTETADRLGLDHSGVTLSTTLRDALKLVADQIPDRAVYGDVL